MYLLISSQNTNITTSVGFFFLGGGGGGVVCAGSLQLIQFTPVTEITHMGIFVYWEPCCTNRFCISSPSQEGGETALMMAAEEGHRGIVERLVRRGASVNVKSEV